jgi:hypothetical protein
MSLKGGVWVIEINSTPSHFCIEVLALSQKKLRSSICMLDVLIFPRSTNFRLHLGSSLIYVNCVCFRIVGSTTYCGVLLLCLSSSCVPYVVSLSVTCGRSVIFSGYSGFLHQ